MRILPLGNARQLYPLKRLSQIPCAHSVGRTLGRAGKQGGLGETLICGKHRWTVPGPVPRLRPFAEVFVIEQALAGGCGLLVMDRLTVADISDARTTGSVV